MGNPIIVFINPQNKAEVYKVVVPEFGLDLFTADAAGKRVLFSDYHNNGSRIAKAQLNIEQTIELGSYSEILLLQLNSDTFKVDHFSPLLNLFNFHSWAPFSVKPQAEEVGMGASLFSQNLLGSSIFGVNYDYNVLNNSQRLNVRYDFRHFYPNLFVEFNQLWEPFAEIQAVKANIQTSEATAGVNVNLLYDGGKLIKGLFVQANYNAVQSKFTFDDTFIDTLLTAQNIRFFTSYFIAHRRGRRDIFSPFSFATRVSFFSSVLSVQNAFAISSNITFKGFLKNDGFNFRAGVQQSTDAFVPNFLAEPRGAFTQRFAFGTAFGAEYGLNIFYPDWKLGKIAYLQRVWAVAFFDYLHTSANSNKQYLSSRGLTVNFDLNPFRYSYLNTFGITLGQLRNGAVFYGPSWRVNY